MKIRYLREVTSPHAIAGAAWSERELEEHLGRQLIGEGVAERVEPTPEPPIVADAATDAPEDADVSDDPTDVILEDGIDATRKD